MCYLVLWPSSDSICNFCLNEHQAFCKLSNKSDGEPELTEREREWEKERRLDIEHGMAGPCRVRFILLMRIKLWPNRRRLSRTQATTHKYKRGWKKVLRNKDCKMFHANIAHIHVKLSHVLYDWTLLFSPFTYIFFLYFLRFHISYLYLYLHYMLW